MVSGAVLILAAAVLASASGIASALFRASLMEHGGSPCFFFPDLADGLAAVIGLVGLALLVWGAATERPHV
jgi:hypothetical protein